MSEAIQKKTRAHTRYVLEDGTIAPGVTTILGVLAKPALIPWANKLGLQGIDSTKYVDAKAEIGTCAHYLIQCDLTGENPDLSEYSPATVDSAENAFLKWLEWRKAKTITDVHSELQLVSNMFRYGGTVDVFASVDGIPTLIDIKTSGSGIWPEMRHQVAAYHQLLVGEGFYPEQVLIVRVGRDDTEGFQTETVGNIDKHFELFLHALAIYRLQKELK